MAKATDWTPAIVWSVITGLVTLGFTNSIVAARYRRVIGGYESGIWPYEPRFAGQSHSSQFLEEWLIRDFFNDRREGIVLDVGAYHPST